MTEASELERWIAVRQCDGQHVDVEASEQERAALARRFDLVSVDALAAKIDLERDGAKVTARGTMDAAFVQTCAVSGDDLPMRVSETISLVFVPEADTAEFDEEIELTADDLDEIAYTGDRFDIGEAVAQSLGLAIDPYAEGPDAEETRLAVDLAEPRKDNPFAALSALKKG